ncbi:uncharacterized protein LOC124442861 isoform X2 [Xenia sp. Carnegie-2017]|uniref:uncharacterized protein LOC124442861 isoform X2 n=1 Tax=Xenia sp. Carnegie-2017 TaxID=2897299 RepID=UPI001F04A35C|nr:uncharacterized protein LOC124442861 isoform X2 [Xenia sp. Carnegie-2017]
MSSVVFIIVVPYERKNEDSEIKQREIKQREIKQREIKQRGSDKSLKRSLTDTIKEEKTTDNDDDVVSLAEQINLPEVLRNELLSLKVHGESWNISYDKQFYQVLFIAKAGRRVEEILGRLTQIGIGIRPKTSISVTTTTVHIEMENNEISGSGLDENQQNLTDPHFGEQKSTKEKFKDSIKSRLTVEQVVKGVTDHAMLTFDFVMFTILASFIAAVGLVEDNAVVLVASMLVSPLMGPILALTFGIVIKKDNLRNIGFKTEICGLAISVVVGLLFGFIAGTFGRSGASWDSVKGIWPTNEMSSRGMTRSLWIGVLIALPSGAGVALSVLGGNAGSLVGVAISASLLPPAVNSGMLWAYAIIAAINPPETLSSFNNSKFKCPLFKDNSYVPTYSCNMAEEAAIMAIISLVLTIINIICIVITAILVLKVKEVVPQASSSNATQSFWTKDIKVAREAYKTFKGNEALNLLNEWKKVRDEKSRSSSELLRLGNEESDNDKVSLMHSSAKPKKVFDEESDPENNSSKDSLRLNWELVEMIKDVEENDEYQSVVRRTPTRGTNAFNTSRQLARILSKDENQQHDYTEDLRTLHTFYRQQSKERSQQPRVAEIFNEQETKQKKNVREFHVVDTENPHHSSVVRVQAPSENSDSYSVEKESGV